MLMADNFKALITLAIISPCHHPLNQGQGTAEHA